MIKNQKMEQHASYTKRHTYFYIYEKFEKRKKALRK